MYVVANVVCVGGGGDARAQLYEGRGRNRELIRNSWNLVRERALTTGHCSEGWYCENWCVLRPVLQLLTD